MKMMFKIAKTKLQSLFYSPIAWLLLVVFAYQVGMIMSGMLEDIVVRQAMGYESWISRDLSGGTIKLLQSAPLRNAEIVLGKYLALMIFGLAMMGVLLFYVLFGVCTIQNIDFPYVLTGMLGLYLLLCAYAAIGLFVWRLSGRCLFWPCLITWVAYGRITSLCGILPTGCLYGDGRKNLFTG